MRAVCDPPEKHRSSQTALPAIVAPAASIRDTMVASRVGTKPSIVVEPFIIGTPATIVLSLTATVRPASGPSPPSVMSVVTYQALYGLSAGSGRVHCRFGATGADRAYRSSTTSHELSSPCTIGLNDATSAADSFSPYASATAASAAGFGSSTGIATSSPG